MGHYDEGDPSVIPAGFARFTVGRTEVVCAGHVAGAVRQALRAGTLYQFAERHPLARPLAGRGVVYSVPLPGNVEHAVVRRNHHGGHFALLTRDLFRPPTRAPRELRLSERLQRAGVPTPAMLGFAVYPAILGLKRVDVMSRLVPDSQDLSHVLMSTDAGDRARAWHATALLTAALSLAGARHHDLNVKNVLLFGSEALVLDVDRVTFGGAGVEVLDANLARLFRSARKWREVHGARVTDAELDEVAAVARAAFARTEEPGVSPSTRS